MPGPRNPKGVVHRLLDIIVEEVSLVDRAANKHRFLIVKRRSENMDDDTNTATPTATSVDGTAAGGAPASGSQSTNGPENEPAAEGGALALAVSALERLTATVEVLSRLGDEDAKPKLAELADELKSFSERLAESVGGGTEGDESDEDATGSEEDSTDDDAETAADGTNGLAEAISGVRATLEQLTSLVGAQAAGGDAEADTENGGETEGSADDASGGAPAASDGTVEKLATINGQLQKLIGTVQKQQKRLARLEKRFGLPNSTPRQEGPAKNPSTEEVGWPLDMNRTFDRDSVDQSVSFHDGV